MKCIVCQSEAALVVSRWYDQPICSKSCLATVNNWKRRQSFSRLPLNCEVCGSVFIPCADSHTCCSNKCKMKKLNSSRSAGILSRTCETCGKSFTTKNTKHRKDAKFCSVSCSNKKNNEKKSLQNRIEASCSKCGAPISHVKSRYELWSLHYCSRTCQLTDSNWLESIVVTRSRYEKWLTKFLEKKSIKVVTGYRPEWLNGKEIDLYLPDHKIGIEIDGLYWHSEQLGKDRFYHIEKTNTCLKNGVRLIHIFEDELIEKKRIVLSRLSHICGLDAKRIHARKCMLSEITNSQCKEFLTRHHIQGFVGSPIRIGAFHENKLVAVMTFGKNRRALGGTPVNSEYELIRFTMSSGVSIPGIASRMFRHFVSIYNPKRVISYSDIRWGSIPSESLYCKLGFTYIGKTSPNYWYVAQNKAKREHRYSYRKSVLVKNGYDRLLSERQIMDNLGYLRIWDCGNYKFEYVRSNIYD